MSRCFLLILFAVACAIPILGQGDGVAGSWDVTLNSPQGTFNLQFNLKQDGEKVSGVVKSQRGERPLEGTLKGKEVTLKWTTKYEENDLPITLTGTLDGSTMKGSADYGGFAQGDFSAKRAGDSAAPAPPTPAPAAAAPADKIDVSGAWVFQVETPAGSGTPTFTFKQEGEKLTGQYKGAFGEAPLTGTVKGNKIDFTIKVQAQGQDATINYTGTVEKDGTMKGTVSVADLGSGTWTGKRQ
ncbi:MAG TPA: hypothetical protein VFP64_10140 [Pyrinomonadaceae bacterium]|nr:hypothetical protein [Pyrinomonadaceae bacterium]